MVAPLPLQQRLEAAAAALKAQRIEALFDSEPDRAAHYRCSAQGLVLDFSKHQLDHDAWQALLELANARDLPQAFAALIRGVPLYLQHEYSLRGSVSAPRCSKSRTTSSGAY